MGSQDHGDPSHKIKQFLDNEGYLIFIIALESFYLNPYNDIAKGSSEGISQTFPDYSSTYDVRERLNIQRVSFNELWCDGADLSTIVQESHTALPIDPYSGYILDPVPLGKRIGIQEGCLSLTFYTQGVLSWDTLSMVTFP